MTPDQAMDFAARWAFRYGYACRAAGDGMGYVTVTFRRRLNTLGDLARDIEHSVALNPYHLTGPDQKGYIEQQLEQLAARLDDAALNELGLPRDTRVSMALERDRLAGMSVGGVAAQAVFVRLLNALHAILSPRVGL